MKKFYILFFSALFFGKISAQCPGERYFNYVFPGNPIVTSNVNYGSNTKSTGAIQQLMLDVYEPNGDTATNRPLVIIAHGGSFIGGSKTDADVVSFCKDLAKLGYVAASIEYRLGMTNLPIPGPDSSDATEAVMRGLHDGRAAVRYFRKNVDVGNNTFKIDPNNIFFAGVSAGGFIALQLAYLDEISEIPSYIDTIGQPGLTGGLEGNSGNPGYSSDVKAIINMCGAIGDTAWMKPGDEPLINFHGTNDGTVPYGSAQITLLGLYPLLQVDGSFTINAQAIAMGIPTCFEIYEGQGHVPASSNAFYYDTTLVKMRNFLHHFVCGDALNCNYNGSIVNAQGAGIVEQGFEASNWSLFPNPAHHTLSLYSSQITTTPLQLSIFNLMGQEVYTAPVKQVSNQSIDISTLAPGFYTLRINSEQQSFSKSFMKQ